MRQCRAGKGGDVFPRTKFARIASYGNNLLPEGHDQQSINAPKAPTRNLRNRDTNEPSARKGGDVFLKIPLALNSSGPNTTNEAEEYRKHFYQV